jgi:hypothetical protein
MSTNNQTIRIQPLLDKCENCGSGNTRRLKFNQSIVGSASIYVDSCFDCDVINWRTRSFDRNSTPSDIFFTSSYVVDNVVVLISNNRKPQKFKGLSKWIKSLNSGLFFQGSGSLKKCINNEDHTVRHCCLGVLCETQNVPHELIDQSLYLPSGNYAVKSGLINPRGGVENVEFMIIKNNHTVISGLQDNLSSLNDSSFVSFKTIAKILDALFINEEEGVVNQ